MAKKTKSSVVLSEEAAHLAEQFAQIQNIPALPNDQIEEVVNMIRKKLKQRVGEVRAAEWRKEYEKLDKTRQVELYPGIDGVLTVAGVETEKIDFFAILVDGRKYSVTEEDYTTLQAYVDGLDRETVDVTFLHSGRFGIEPSKKSRNKKKLREPAESIPKEGILFNCTARVPKAWAMAALDDKRNRMIDMAKVLAESAHRQWLEKQGLQDEKAEPPQT